MLAAGLVPQAVGAVQAAEVNSPLPRLAGKRTRTLDEEWTSYDSVTHYNNFYEFGTSKEDPARNARDAAATRRGRSGSTGWWRSRRLIDIDRLTKTVSAGRTHLPAALRRRLVDGDTRGSGLPLAKLLIKLADPLGSSEIRRVRDAERSRARCRVSAALCCSGPMSKGVRLDEALHPLTMLALGLYGRVLPNQNGAPLRLVVPWKYGFKSIKSIVRGSA
jgi:sulfoxide reductase catalytic subunit YedY